MNPHASPVLPTTGKSEFSKVYQRLAAKVSGLPFPIRPQLEQCLGAIEAQDAVAAVWFLKDTTEATVRLLFVVATAEILRLVPNEQGSGWLAAGAEPLPEPLRGLAQFVRYNHAPSLGALLTRLEVVALPHASAAGSESVVSRLVPLWKGVGNALRDLKDWRNAFHGHGALGSHARAADELKRNISFLDMALEGLRPLWSELHLMESSLSTASATSEVSPSGNPAVSLRPLVELLDVPGATRAPWLLDAADPRKARMKYRSASTLEPRAVSRASIQSVELQAVERLAEESEERGRPVGTGAEEGDLELGWLTHIENLRFAGYDRKHYYTEPTYLVKRVEDALKASPGGALRITGPGGSGKSFLVRGLTDRWRMKKHRYVVLPYYAIPGQGVDIASFVVAIYGAVLEENRRLAGQGARGLSLPNEGRQPGCDDFPSWLCSMVSHNRHVERFILIADGLDELRPGWSDSSIVDILPREIPERLFLLLSSRDDQELHQCIRKSVQDIQWIPGSPVLIELDSGENTKTLLEYLGKCFPEIDKRDRKAVIERAEGKFLHVEMLGRGLREGAFNLSPGKELPRHSEIVTRYLDWLAGSVRRMPAYGRALKETVAFLTVAGMPVPLECFIDWGIDPRWVEEIVIDLQGILTREKSTERSLVAGLAEPYAYRLYHRNLIDHLRQDPEWVPQIEEAKNAIIEAIVNKRAGRWDDQDAVSWGDPADAFAMLALGKVATGESVLERPVIVKRGSIHYKRRVEENERFLRLVKRRVEKAVVGKIEECQKKSLASDLAELERAQEFPATPTIKQDALVSKDEHLDLAYSDGSALAWRLLSRAQQLEQRFLHPAGALECLDAAEILTRLIAPAGADLNAQRNTRRLLAWIPIRRADSLRSLMQLHHSLGEAEFGERAFRQLANQFGETPEALRDLSVSLNTVADSLLAEGDHPAALAKYREGEAICRQILAQYGETPHTLRTLSASLINAADVLLAERDAATALAKYDEVEAISRQLLARYGETPEALHDLSKSVNRVANMLLAEGDRCAALAKYEEGEAVSRQILARYGETPQALRDLWASLNSFGDVLLAEGNHAAALTKYEEGEAIRRQLQERFGETPQALRDLWVSLNRVASVLLAEGNHTAALAKYEEGEAITRQLLKQYGENSQSLRDLSVSVNGVAGVLLALGDRDAALQKYEEREEICGSRLSKYQEMAQDRIDWSASAVCVAELLRGKGLHDSACLKYQQIEMNSRGFLELYGETPEALGTLLFSVLNVADLLHEQGYRREALAKYEEAEAISRQTVVQYGETPGNLRDLWVSLDKVATLVFAEGEGDRHAALAKYKEGEAISRQILARYGETPHALRDLWASLGKVGDVLVADYERPAALAKYEECEAISRQILLLYGETPGALLCFSISLNKAADVLLAEGDEALRRDLLVGKQLFAKEDPQGALALFERVEVIRREILSRCGVTLAAMRNLWVSLGKVGDVFVAGRDHPAALAKYQECEAISCQILSRYGETPEALRDLRTSLNRVADALLSGEDRSAALAKYEEGEAISRHLLAQYGETPETLLELSDSLRRIADVLLAKEGRAAALAKYKEVEATSRRILARYRKAPHALQALRNLSVSLETVADVLLAEGDRQAALARYQEAEGVNRRILARYGKGPETLRHDLSLIRQFYASYGEESQALRALAMSLTKVASVLLEGGDRLSALVKYQETEAIRRQLLARHSDTPEALRDPANSLTKIATMLLAERDGHAAPAGCEDAETIRCLLQKHFGETPAALRDLSISLSHVAEVLIAEGDGSAALAKYVEAEAIDRQILARYGETQEALRDLASSLQRVADILLEEGDGPLALVKYEEMEAISRQRLARFGQTPDAFRDVWVSLNKIADVLLAKGDRPAALAKYEEGQAISRQLLVRYGETPEALRDVWVSLTRIADVLLAEGDLPQALARYEEGEGISRQLLARYGETSEALRDLSLSLERVAYVLLAEGDCPAALAKYEEGEVISRQLLEQFGETVEALSELRFSLNRIAGVYLKAGDRRTALAKYEEGEAISRQLLIRHGGTPEALRNLALSIWRSANVLLAEGGQKKAVKKLTEAVRLAKKYVQKSSHSSDATDFLATLKRKLDEEVRRHEN